MKVVLASFKDNKISPKIDYVLVILMNDGAK